MQISDVKKLVIRTIEGAKRQAAERRERTDAASKAYETFLETMAVPLFKQVGNVLRAEGLAFTVFTPGGSVRLASDRNAADYVELSLDTDERAPFVKGHSSRHWANRTIESEEAIGSPDTLTEEEVLAYVLKNIEPFVER